jgi:LmbE family N-acetylglucosaminyl deacetylase
VAGARVGVEQLGGDAYEHGRRYIFLTDLSVTSQGGGDRVVILSPHFDDAVLSCWSVLRGTGEVEVVNVFTGAPAHATDLNEAELLTGADDALARARERANEDRAALAIAGARSRNLDLLDHLHWTAGRPPPPPRWRRIARRLVRRLREAPGPDEERRREVVAATFPHVDRQARIYAPAGLGGHPDHVLVRELGCRLLREGARVSFYAEQPYGYVYGWPHWVIGESPDPYLDLDRDWRRYLDTASMSFADLRAEVVRLDEAHEQKLRALRLYRSQFSVLESGANRRVSNPELTGWEVFWHA